MRPVMLVVAALLTSPALAGVLTGAMPMDVAMGRYLVVAGVSWVLLTIAAEWFWAVPAQPSVPETTGEPGPD